jgi:hypothetical protein
VVRSEVLELHVYWVLYVVDQLSMPITSNISQPLLLALQSGRRTRTSKGRIGSWEDVAWL